MSVVIINKLIYKNRWRNRKGWSNSIRTYRKPFKRFESYI